MKPHQKTRWHSMLLAFVLVVACAVPAQVAQAESAPATHSIVERTYPVYIGSTADDTLNQEFPLSFIDGVDDLPYVNLNDWAALLYFINTDQKGDTGYDLEVEYKGDSVVFERENGYTLTFDFANDKLFFIDYDAFMHNSDDSTLIDLVSENGMDENGTAELIWRDKQASFNRYGDEMTVDLGANGIHMIAQDEGYYVPMQTLNDFTLLRTQVSVIFNGQALFLANDDLFYSYAESSYTEIARIYYSAPTGERSDALAEYSYNELCLALDTFYGLKEVHDISSFRQLFWQIGLDEILSGNDAMDADNALKRIIDYDFDDLHSVFNEYSYLAGLNSISNSTGFSNRKLEAHGDEYGKARKAAYPDGWLNYEEVGNTAYITFDTFESNYYGKGYYMAKDEGEELDDTVALIIYAHEQITRPDSPIENVVLDLTNNTGGAVDAAVVVLGWFLGDAPFSVKNMATGAMSTAVYRADVNLDHEYDEKDTVADKNLYCLVSPVSFSCGNLVPAALKASQKVTLIGRTTGGGSCVVQPMSTAYGTLFQISAALRMSFLKNGSFYDIDQGVDPDYYVDHIENLYNRTAMTEFINGLF
ncbi:MAG: S41 family peptidase [Oscillospiraceae bacterium]|nr:S41 family peptidase [Oscillospiraceae bacterium]